MLLPEQLYQLSPRDLRSAFISEFVRTSFANVAAGAPGGTGTPISIIDGYALILDEINVGVGVGAADTIQEVDVTHSWGPGENIIIIQEQNFVRAAGAGRSLSAFIPGMIIGVRRGQTRTLTPNFQTTANMLAAGTIQLNVHGWLIPAGNFNV